RSDIETATDIAAHATMMGVSVQLFETVSWVEEIVEPARAAAIRRLPRALTAAGYSCFTGRPEQGAANAHAAVELESNPAFEPFELDWASLVEALAQVYSGHLDRYVEITTRLAALPGPARAFGLPALIDGLQATGRVEEAIARQPGSDHHVPDLPDLADRLASTLGSSRFDEYASSGTAMDLNDAAHYARQQIQLARSELTTEGVGGRDRPGGLSRREVEVLR